MWKKEILKVRNNYILMRKPPQKETRLNKMAINNFPATMTYPSPDPIPLTANPTIASPATKIAGPGQHAK